MWRGLDHHPRGWQDPDQGQGSRLPRPTDQPGQKRLGFYQISPRDMTPPKLSYIPELVEHHYGELQFLWGQRGSALRSPKYTLREFSALEVRIEAHVQGLLVAGVELIHIVEEGLTSDDPATTFAAAYALI